MLIFFSQKCNCVICETETIKTVTDLFSVINFYRDSVVNRPRCISFAWVKYTMNIKLKVFCQVSYLTTVERHFPYIPFCNAEECPAFSYPEGWLIRLSKVNVKSFCEITDEARLYVNNVCVP